MTRAAEAVGVALAIAVTGILFGAFGLMLLLTSGLGRLVFQ